MNLQCWAGNFSINITKVKLFLDVDFQHIVQKICKLTDLNEDEREKSVIDTAKHIEKVFPLLTLFYNF